MKLTPIPANKVDYVWPQVEPLITRACRYNNTGETAETIRDRIGKDYHLAMIDDDSVAVFQALDKCLHIVILAGRDLVKRHEDFFKCCQIIGGYIGCTALSWKGRKGWWRVADGHNQVRGEGDFVEIPL